MAIRDLSGEERDRNDIDRQYLKNDNVSNENNDYKIKLKQVESDWQAYKNLILGETLSYKDKLSKVYINYEFFKSKLNALKNANQNLSELIGLGLDKFRVVTVELEPVRNPWEDPQEIFETMNSLGKPLSLADLVRNYLLVGKSSDEQTQLYNQYWLSIENNMRGRGSVSDFIRDYLQLRTAKEQKKASPNNAKELYRIFKEYVKGKAIPSEKILDEFSQLVPLYIRIVFAKMPYLRMGNDEIAKKLYDLNVLQASTANSFLLGLLEEHRLGAFSDADLVEILDAFRIYIARLRILGLTAGANRTFPTLVKYFDALKGASDKRQKMFEILSEQQSNLRLPSDDELRIYLSTANFYNFEYSDFILKLIEEKLTKSFPADNIKLQVEHIMPRTLNDAWRAALGENAEEVHQELCDNIGNLTLIRHNQELGNKPFREKKAVYENNSGLQIAKTCITDSENWNAESIRRRAQWLMDYLVKEVLPIPAAMQKRNNFSNKPRGLSFEYLGIIGEEIRFVDDRSYVAKVVSDDEVEFEGKKWKLTPITKELKRRVGTASPSESYQGAHYWEYDGKRLITWMEQL